MSSVKRYQANPVVSQADEADGAVLYNPDIDIASVVNPTGQQLWIFLQTPHTRDEMIEFFLDSYSEVSAEQAGEDLDRFIETLAPDFLLEIDNGR